MFNSLWKSINFQNVFHLMFSLLICAEFHEKLKYLSMNLQIERLLNDGQIIDQSAIDYKISACYEWGVTRR